MSTASQHLSEVMRQPITTTSIATRVQAALELATSQGIHHLPVMDSERLMGFVCTCNLYEAQPDATLSEVMKEPVTLVHTETVVEAARVMRRRAVGSVIVIEDDRPCGIVTRGDLLQTWDDAERILGPSRCQCCGLTRHLRESIHGQVLCMFCDERASDQDWFELGEGY